MRPLRSFSLAGLGSALLLGCGQPEIEAADEETNKELVRAYLQTLVMEENWAAWAEYFAPDASLNDSGFALQIMRGTSDGLHFSFGDLTLDVGEQIAEGDMVATRFTFRGIHERPFNAQPATNLPVELGGFVIDRFENGRIVESHMLLDVWGLSQRTAGAARNN